VGFKLSQDDSAAKIAHSLDDRHTRLILVVSLSVLYAVGFVIWLTRLDDLLRRASNERRFFASWVLIGGVLFVALHSVSDIGIYALLAGKVASYAAQHDNGLAYSLYLLTYALDSVADVFASLLILAAGLQIFTARPLPRWLGWLAVAASPFLFLQAFGLGGVVGRITGSPSRTPGTRACDGPKEKGEPGLRPRFDSGERTLAQPSGSSSMSLASMHRLCIDAACIFYEREHRYGTEGAIDRTPCWVQ
jgi:hypothetical protein